MSDIIQLKEGRYKGVALLFTEAETQGGNRLIKFNYPGTDNQSIERQGKIPKVFNLTIWIPFEDYYSVRDNTLRVLEDGIAGVFTHPTFGDVTNVINGVYTLSEKQSELGRASISVVFEQDTGPGVPVQSGNLLSQVLSESNALNEVLNDDLGRIFGVDLPNTGNFGDAIDALSSVADVFEEVSTFTESGLDTFADFVQDINSFRRDINDMIQVPVDMANRVTSLFTSLSFITDDLADLTGPLDGLFDFGEPSPKYPSTEATFPTINPTTVGLAQRKQNRDIIQSTIQVGALSYAYVGYAQKTYTTTDELESAQTALESQYTKVRDLITNEALEQLDRLRVQAQKTLEDARVNTRSIITVETPVIPLSVLVFNYYGNTDLVDTIADLNNIKQNAFVEGEVRILSD